MTIPPPPVPVDNPYSERAENEALLERGIEIGLLRGRKDRIKLAAKTGTICTVVGMLLASAGSCMRNHVYEAEVIAGDGKDGKQLEMRYSPPVIIPDQGFLNDVITHDPVRLPEVKDKPGLYRKDAPKPY